MFEPAIIKKTDENDVISKAALQLVNANLESFLVKGKDTKSKAKTRGSKSLGNKNGFKSSGN